MFRRFASFVLALGVIVLLIALVIRILSIRAGNTTTNPPGLLGDNFSTQSASGNTVFPPTISIIRDIEDGSLWTVVRVDGRGEDAVATFTNGIRTVSGYCVNAGMDIPPIGAQYYAYLNGGITFMSIDTIYQNFRITTESTPVTIPTATQQIFAAPNPTSTNINSLGVFTTPTILPVFTGTMAPLPTMEMPVLPGATITVDEPRSQSTGLRLPGWILGVAMVGFILFIILLRIQDRV